MTTVGGKQESSKKRRMGVSDRRPVLLLVKPLSSPVIQRGLSDLCGSVLWFLVFFEVYMSVQQKTPLFSI